jgi:hypothetical protein
MIANLNIAESFGLRPFTDPQLRFLAATEPKNVLFCGGRGSGKTVVSLVACILEALSPTNAGLDSVCLTVTDTTSKSAHFGQMIQMATNFKKAHGWSLIRKTWNSPQMRAIRWITGHTTHFRSFQKCDSLRGLTFSFCYLDEIDVPPDPLYINEVVAPCVRGAGSLRMLYSTTPSKGMGGMTKAFCSKIEQGDLAYYQVIAPSASNQYLAQSVLDRWKSFSRERYRREVLAILTKPKALVFPEFGNQHLIDWEYNGGQWGLGIDFGFSRPHALAIGEDTINGVDSDIVFDEWAGFDVPSADFRKAIIALVKKVGTVPGYIACDRSDGEGGNLKRWLRIKFPDAEVRWLSRKQDQLIWPGCQTVRSRLLPWDGIPRLYFCKELSKRDYDGGVIESLRMYKRKERDGELIDQPVKDGWDHSMDCLRYFIATRHPIGLEEGDDVAWI